MLRNVLTLILFFSMSANAQTDIESAKAAYEAGDYEAALEILIPLADQGDAKAQYNLAIMYRDGWGVQQDYVEVIKWYRKAAEQEYAEAQHNLAIMYRDGLGITQDYAEALKWTRKAAEQGHAVAQSNLGFMYHQGLGVQQDFIQAYIWLGFAAAGGIEHARNERASIESDMTSEQLEEALKLARELRDKFANKTDQ